MQLAPVQPHAVLLRLLENVDEPSPDVLTSPALLQSLFREGVRRKWSRSVRVSLCAFPPCPEPCFGAPILQLRLFSVLLAAGLGARAHRKASSTPFLLYMKSKAPSVLAEVEGASRICPELAVALFHHSWGVGAAEAGRVQFLLRKPSSKAKTQVPDWLGLVPYRSSLKVTRCADQGAASFCARWPWCHHSLFVCVATVERDTVVLQGGRSD